MIDFSFYHFIILYLILKYDQSLTYDMLEHELVVNVVKIVFIKLSSNLFYLYQKQDSIFSKSSKDLIILIAARIFILL